MKHIKLFEQFIVESQQETLIDKILIALEDDILNLLIKYETNYKKQYDREMSKYDRELTRLIIIADFLGSIEKYTLPTDSLISCSSSISRKGNLEISAFVKREDTVYSLNTEVIYAGGYNIQTLHYRYITKTDLPKTGNTKVSDEYTAKIKKLTKYEKLNTELQDLVQKIEDNTAKISINVTKSEDEIWKEIKNDSKRYMYGQWASWDEIIKRGADKNFDYSEELYKEKVKEDYLLKLELWKKINITWIERQNIEYQKRVNSITKKLNELA
jgi:hypothetical protein